MIKAVQSVLGKIIYQSEKSHLDKKKQKTPWYPKEGITFDMVQHKTRSTTATHVYTLQPLPHVTAKATSAGTSHTTRSHPIRNIRFLYNILTPMMAFNSAMVTCLALSTAWATCCWCSWERNGMICAQIAFSRFAISVWNGERGREERNLWWQYNAQITRK